MLARCSLAAVLVAGICLPLLAAGDDAPTAPKSLAARLLLQKRDLAVSKATATYTAAVSVADHQLVLDADTALKKAMDQKDLDTANELNAIKHDAENRLNVATEETSTPSRAGGPMTGRWHVRSNKWDTVWTFTGDTVSHPKTKDRGKVKLVNGVVMINWPTGIIERFTPAGEHWLFESWDSAHAKGYPTEPPTNFGYAERATESAGK